MPTWLAELFNPGGGIAQIINTVASFIPNPEEKAKAQLAIQQAIVTAALQADSEQRAINKVEASNPSLFVAGARPACLWLCVIALAYQWLFVPLFTWGVALAGASHSMAPPVIDNADIQALLYALLGLGAYRTVDKMVPGGATSAIAGILSGKKT
jgi:hypothetical protein